jgi:predicted DNA-binding protein
MIMAVYSQRVQTMLTPEQYGVLTQLSTQEQKPVSVLVRDAIEKVYFAEAERLRRQSALQRLLALDAPVADWSQMEDEIAQGVIV